MVILEGQYICEVIEFIVLFVELKGGCVYGTKLVRPSPQARRHKGAQVMTYKEVEAATNGFSEGNVIGKAGLGVVYRGVLADATEVAIKVLRRAGKQGERAFRVEVIYSPFLPFLHLFIFSFLVSLFCPCINCLQCK